VNNFGGSMNGSLEVAGKILCLPSDFPRCLGGLLFIGLDSGLMVASSPLRVAEQIRLLVVGDEGFAMPHQVYFHA